MEKRADSLGHEHLAEGVYASALERLHEVSLIPAVLDEEETPSHPNLYDRMVAAGAHPTYERPAAPSVNLRTVAWLLPLVAMSGWVLAGVAMGLIR